MKKFIYLALALLFLNSPAFAADKVVVKVGPVTGVAKGETVVAAVQGDFINLSLGVIGKRGSATVTALLPANFSKEKGSEVDLFSLVGETAEANPGEIALGFTATASKPQSAIAITAAETTVVTGKLKVIGYDEETKELLFALSAKATPYIQIKTKFSGSETTTPTKNLAIKAGGIVTLP